MEKPGYWVGDLHSYVGAKKWGTPQRSQSWVSQVEIMHPNPVSPTSAIQPLYTGAAVFMLARYTSVDIEEAIENFPGSCDLLLAFRYHYPQVWDDFIRLLGVEEQDLLAKIEANGTTNEPRVSEFLIEQMLANNPSIDTSVAISCWSEPCTKVLFACKHEGKITRQLVSEVRWLELLLNEPCEARQILLEICKEERLAEALSRLEPAPDFPDLGSALFDNVNRMHRLVTGDENGPFAVAPFRILKSEVKVFSEDSESQP